MKILILASLCIGLSVADRPCEWGPSYWCSSLPAARECGGFQHCMNTVWANQNLEKDSTDVCTYCETVVQDVRDFISNQQSQAEIKQFLDTACSLVPSQSMSQECTNLVDTYLQEVLDLISSELDPQVVCSLLGLCTGLQDTVRHPNTLHRVPLGHSSIKVPVEASGAICADCTQFMNDIKAMITDKATEAQIEQYIEQNVCAMLGGMADECNALVEAYLPEIMDLIAAEVNAAEVCQMMGFCNATSTTQKALLAILKLRKSPLYTQGTGVAGTAECEVCHMAVQELRSLYQDKATQAEMENFIKTEICSKLGALRGACEETVDNYGPVIFELIYQELDPVTLCQALGLCSTSQAAQSTQHVVRMSQQPDQPTRPVKTSATCILCQYVMTELDTILGDNATEAEIQAGLEKVCSFLPPGISAECTSFIDEYGPAIFQLLVQELDPQQVCTALGLCSSVTLVQAPVRQSEFCGVCETIIQYLDSLLEENATVHEIEQVLEKVCNFLPAAIRGECDSIVAQYAPLILQLLPELADPNELCTTLGLCGKAKNNDHSMETIVPVKAIPLGIHECTYGPAFWCASRANAERCKTVSHCEKHVWNN